MIRLRPLPATLCKPACISLRTRRAGFALHASVAVVALLAACGEDPQPVPDGGVVVQDSGPPPDGGVRDVCPALAAPACSRASDCGEDQTITSCAACPAYNRSLCLFGTCADPALLTAGDPRNIRIGVGPWAARLRSLMLVTVAQETSGGAALGCDAFQNSGPDLTTGCYNVVDTRQFRAERMGDVYVVTSSQFPADMPVMFIVYGYESDDLTGAPVSVSCTAYPGGAAGSGREDVVGEPMQAVQ